MANESLIEQLDNVVEAIIANPGAPLPRVNASVAPLLRLAAQLRDLPRENFKARLKDDLNRRASMTTTAATTAVKPIREGFHTITPYIAVKEAAELIDFVKQAFGAEGVSRGTGSQGGIHAEVRIGDSMVMIGGGEALRGTPMPTTIHLYVKDVEAVYERALQAGATSTEEPVDQPYGDREAGVKDLAGNQWYIATNKATGHAPEGLRSVTPYLHPRGVDQMVDFLKQAFGAEEALVYRAKPDGPVVHAKIKIGDSILEMGEAHGEYQPRPTMFYLYVNDVDAWYRRAVAAGATSMGEPADQPYGDRTAAVTDPFGNTWYMATHIKDV